MAVDLLSLGQHLGALEARIAALENYLFSGAVTMSAPNAAPAVASDPVEDTEDINIPGLGSMRALFEGQLAQHGGASGLVAKAMAMATAPAPAPAPVPSTATAPQAPPPSNPST